MVEIDGAFSVLYVLFFKQKTAYEMHISDWSSDVCSSDLTKRRALPHRDAPPPRPAAGSAARPGCPPAAAHGRAAARSAAPSARRSSIPPPAWRGRDA